MGAGALGQVDLGLVLQQDVAVLVENGVGQLAPVPLFPVLVVHVVVVDADGEAGVVGDVPLLDRGGVGQDVAGAVGEQVELRDLLPGLQGEDGAQEVPHRPVLRVGDAGLAAAHRVGGEHVGDAQAVIAHGDQTALLVRGEGDVLAVYRVGPADLAVLLPLRRAVHGLNQPPDLLRGIAGLLRTDGNALQEAVAVLVVGVHGGLPVEPAHGVAVGLIGVGPAVPGDLPAVRQLPGRADVGLGVRAGAAEIDHVLPGLAVGVPLPLCPGQFPVGVGIGGADLLRRLHRRLRRGGDGVQVQLVRRVRRRVVQIALPVLHQQDGRDPGQLEGGVVAGRLRPPLQGRVLLLEQAADPVGLPVHGTHQGAVGAQAAQHVKLDVPDHPVLLPLCQGGGVGPGAVFAVLLVGEADKPHLGVGGHILQGLGRIQQGGHTGGVVVGPVGGGHAVVVGGQDQNIRVGGGGLLHGDHIVPGAALAVGIGLEGDLIAHLLEPPLQILHSVRLPLGGHRPVGRREGLQIGPKLAYIGQGAGLLQHHQGLRRGDGPCGGQLVRPAPRHHPRLEAPEHRLPGPLGHAPRVPELGEPLGRCLRRAGLPPEDSGELLPGHRPVRRKGPVPHAGETALRRRPGHRAGILSGHVGEGAGPGDSGTPRRLVEQLGRHPPGDGFPRDGQEVPADGGLPAPGQRLLRPLGPVRRGSRQPRRDHQGAAQQQGKQSLHNITSSANMVP